VIQSKLHTDTQLPVIVDKIRKHKTRQNKIDSYIWLTVEQNWAGPMRGGRRGCSPGARTSRKANVSRNLFDEINNLKSIQPVNFINDLSTLNLLNTLGKQKPD